MPADTINDLITNDYNLIDRSFDHSNSFNNFYNIISRENMMNGIL